MDERLIKVLHITSMYPTDEKPYFGIFVKSQVESLKKIIDVEVLILPGLQGIWSYIKSIPAILAKLNNQYDVIHIHYGNVSTLIKLLYWGKTPIITSYCGGDLLGGIKNDGSSTFKGFFFKKINALFSKYDSCSIAQSEELASKIQNTAENIRIVPYCVDVNKFFEIDKKIARQKIGIIDVNKKIILFPADPLRPGKNFPFLEKILNRFVKKYDYQLLSFQGGKVNDEMMPYYFNAADVVLFPSLSEGSPTVIKEAMACNCLIFSSDCGDVSLLLKGVKGSKVLPLQIGEWIQAMHEFFSGRVSQRVSNSREILIKQELDTESIAQKIISLYIALRDNKGNNLTILEN